MNLREKLSHFFVTGKSLGTAQTFSDLSPQADDTQETMLAKLLGVRRRITGTALASAARTSTTQSSSISVGSAGGVLGFLNITSHGGGVGLKMSVLHLDPVSGLWFPLGIGTTYVTAASKVLCFAGAGAATASGFSYTTGNQCMGFPLGDTIRFEITHGDANSHTYSVGYCLTP